ncbi:glycosyltransferase family 2 protein [Agrobacterium fabrum]|uniref:glycosyltransferase family 2 protein n=1 Tax=Agrobacterium fabrum TaxID=1176649 RepID=UPI000B891933|nr:glycosyltransferase family 2 protein [Agrobacterium fabrum]WIE29192.1 glycosyltransferase family 2 protein [Agrobacterium fabrum]WIE45152.1 glycosyltransferase family 2 protein [Agrobacterium fabrum]
MPNLSAADVTVISVCYKSEDVIHGMIASVPEAASIIIVDNGGDNRFRDFPYNRNIRVVKLDKNEGFGRGCNAGAEVATTPWLLFLNPDARLTDGAIEALLVATERYPAASAFNPRIANGDSTPYFKRRSWLLSHQQYMPRGWPTQDRPISVLSGAAIFVSSAIFRDSGGFDPNIFLYHEDDDLSLRLAKIGPLLFVRDALIVHNSGHSSGRSPEIAHFKAYQMARSRIYTGKKHHRPFPFLSALCQAVFLFLSPAMFFSARRRAKALGFLQGIVSAYREAMERK